ncbi:DUF3108 domain-containing protein [Capnocytophaga cynodegmi]|uniref:DUF3108 domain-containing protein n=1 Tax=Capnocytophaga cynodegmi TaxID=28189 RepID=UPI0003A8C8E0|nr:DUF3108 domain-containing protein [Capnocytophaga cynodegmi]CEN38972.1 conserved exported hypothetical protein [Capnocytophaga cynodegmi]
MKRIMIFFFLLAFAKIQGQELPFKGGEWLKFKVKYGIFNTSEATLHLKEVNYEGEKVFHAVGKGSTTGLARVFFRVDDTYESYFGVEDGTPRYFVRDIYEGGYTKHLKMYFNHVTQRAKIDNIETGGSVEITVPIGIQDVISGFYSLRQHPEIDSIKEGQEVEMDMIFDDDEIFKFKLRYLGKEKIKTKFGSVNTMIFRPLVQDGRVFKEQESLTLWITDDQNKIPVRVKASLRVGSLVADLDAFNGLKYPTELKK